MLNPGPASAALLSSGAVSGDSITSILLIQSCPPLSGHSDGSIDVAESSSNVENWNLQDSSATSERKSEKRRGKLLNF